MQSNNLKPDELVEFARFLFGDTWREELPKHLNISRKQLVLTLASGDSVPETIVSPLLTLMDAHLGKQERMSRELRKRVAELRGGSKVERQPRVVRHTAS